MAPPKKRFCQKGHDTHVVGRDSHRRCKQCRRDSSLKWKKENPEKVRETFRKWTKANKDKRNEYRRKWREENPEKEREYGRRFRERHPEKDREQSLKWRKDNPEKYRENVRNQIASGRHAINNKESRKKAIEAGKCGSCRSRPVVSGTTECMTCKHKGVERQRLRRHFGMSITIIRELGLDKNLPAPRRKNADR